jgi:hypothetical protein
MRPEVGDLVARFLFVIGLLAVAYGLALSLLGSG